MPRSDGRTDLSPGPARPPPAGWLALWDIVAGQKGEPDFPMPWADRPEYSHLTTLRTVQGIARRL